MLIIKMMEMITTGASPVSGAEESGEHVAMSELNLRELLSLGLKVMYFPADVTFKTDLNITPRQEEYFLFHLTQPCPARQIFYLDLNNF